MPKIYFFKVLQLLTTLFKINKIPRKNIDEKPPKAKNKKDKKDELETEKKPKNEEK